MNNRHFPLPRAQDIEDIEESLRLAAPSPSPELRERILARCQGSARHARAARTARPRSGAWRGVGWRVAGVAGVGALCVLQWLVVSHFDARSQAAIHGRPPASMWARATPNTWPEGDDLPDDAARDWPQALQSRALLLSALMDNSDAALWPAPPEAQSS